MTKLQYLRLRNKDKVPFDKLPQNDRFMLRTLDETGDVQLWCSPAIPAREPRSWRRRLYPNDSLSANSVYRVSEKLRPRGIPDDIHERHST